MITPAGLKSRVSKMVKELGIVDKREQSARSQMLFRNYAMERLLERIALSKYKNNFILKGGKLITAIVGVDMRSTMDIDTSVVGLNLTASNIRRILTEIISIDLDDAIKFQINKNNPILSESEYEGVQFQLYAYLGNMRMELKFDISTGDIITPSAIEYKYKLMFEDRTINLYTYNIETVIAEKLESILARGAGNSRMKDFYDIFILTDCKNNKSSTISEFILNKAINETINKRGSKQIALEYESVIAEIIGSTEIAKLWEKYCKSEPYAANIKFELVCEKIYELCRKFIRPNILDHSAHNDISNQMER